MVADRQRRAFISYSRTNKDFATKLTRGLRSAGYPVWFDLFDIPTGARWDDEVEKALQECTIFMVILTPASIASENVKDEIGYAIDHKKRILPVLLEECDVPLRLRRFQYVDFTTKSFEEGFDSAKELLGDLVDEVTTPVVARTSVVEEQLEKKAESERKAKEEAERLTTQKAEEERLAKVKAESDRKAKEDAERLAVQKPEEERLAKVKAESDRKAKEDAERLSVQKAEEERLARVKAESERKAKEEVDRLAAQKAEEEERLASVKAEAERKAKEEAVRLSAQKAETERLAKQKAEEERLVKVKAESERKAKEEADRLAAQKVEAGKLTKKKAEEEQMVLAKLKDEEGRRAREKQDLEKKRLQTEAQQPKPILTAQKSESGNAPSIKKSRMPLFLGVSAVVVMVLIGIAIVAMANMTRGMIPNTGSQVESPTAEALIVESIPTPTKVQKAVNVPTVKPSPTAGPQKFFTEEFDEGIENWTRLDVTGSTNTDVDKLSLDTKGSGLIFDFNTKQLYTYLFYEPFEYENVAVEARVENRGMNDNNISLICRYNGEGWYEFNVANSGLYNFLYGYYEPDGDINYAFLVDGGSNKIKSGNDINVYKIICNDRKLSLYINGTETRVFEDNQYVLRKGKIGISASSFDQLPVIVEYDWVKISEP